MEMELERRDIRLVGSHNREFLADITLSGSGADSPVVIFSHGFKGFKDWGPFNLVAEAFAKQGFHFVKFNFAFNGTTSEAPYDFADLDAFGKNNFIHELDDLDTVISHVENGPEGISATDIYLIGHSRGGGISLLKSIEDQRVRRTVTWASVTSFEEYINGQMVEQWEKDGVIYIENSRTGQMMPLYYQLYESYHQNRSRLNIPEAISRLRIPVLMIHGSGDETVPAERSEKLADSHPDISFVEIPGASHSFGSLHPIESEMIPPDLAMAIDHSINFFRS